MSWTEYPVKLDSSHSDHHIRQSNKKHIHKNFFNKFKNNSIFWGFPCSLTGKESICNVGGPGSIPGSETSAEEGIGYPLQILACSKAIWSREKRYQHENLHPVFICNV